MSLKTDNFKLYKYEDNDIGDLRFINDSMDIIDKGINPFYVATKSSTNVYKITTGLNKTSLANGYSVKVAIPSGSNGAVSIIVDTCNAVAVKKPNGNAVTNFKQNGVYSLTYYNSVFILASGGVDDVNFSTSDLLENKSANNSDGEKVNGTMPNIGQQTATINAGGKVVIAKGYHDGTGYVQSNSMSKQLTDLGSTLTSADQLVNGVKAVDKKGNLITGTATIESLGGRKISTGIIHLTEKVGYKVTFPFIPDVVLYDTDGVYVDGSFLYKDSVRLDEKDGNWHMNSNQNIAKISVNGNEYTYTGTTVSGGTLRYPTIKYYAIGQE